jgi:hypothetical protein
MINAITFDSKKLYHETTTEIIKIDNKTIKLLSFDLKLWNKNQKSLK